MAPSSRPSRPSTQSATETTGSSYASEISAGYSTAPTSVQTTPMGSHLIVKSRKRSCSNRFDDPSERQCSTRSCDTVECQSQPCHINPCHIRQ
ncbi:hypothetical protein M011DRAFT_468335 [Sporormia fimetaria CBS 119925]|uniref:Uncharacterized protein n=1 Tax=Sporormia fimetaria CBS 119925 TaxID=1340428 RepID=A0A6A6VC03_9PLEO|nr:hypothetical protein M011DRAFT_468335 [Sporormia fimetaria CBS 119925]